MQSEKGDLFSNFVLKIFTLHVYMGFIGLYAVLLLHELECVKCRLCRRACVCLPSGLCLPSILFHECKKVNAVMDLKGIRGTPSLSPICLLTARKQSLGQVNIFAPVCYSVHKEGGGCYPTPKGKVEGDLVQTHSQGGSWGGSGPGPHPRGKLRGIWLGGCLLWGGSALGYACSGGGGACSGGRCGDPLWRLLLWAVRILLECILVSCKFLAKIMPNNRLAPPLVVPPGKSWIRHCNVTGASMVWQLIIWCFWQRLFACIDVNVKVEWYIYYLLALMLMLRWSNTFTYPWDFPTKRSIMLCCRKVAQFCKCFVGWEAHIIWMIFWRCAS